MENNPKLNWRKFLYLVAKQLWNLFVTVVTSLIQVLDLKQNIEDLIKRVLNSDKAKIMLENLIGRSVEAQFCDAI